MNIKFYCILTFRLSQSSYIALADYSQNFTISNYTKLKILNIIVHVRSLYVLLMQYSHDLSCNSHNYFMDAINNG